MKKYKVYFDQVNQTYFEIKAKNRGNAIRAAIARWRAENIPSWASYIEEEETE